MNFTSTSPQNQSFDPYAISRPAPVLMVYYALCSLLAGPAFPFVLAPLFCKYITLRYKFDDKGVSMSYGVLFRRETLLTYRRIQDIHLTNNIIQRWLGLATVSIQTASGSAGAEVAIDGVLEAEALRDFLYQRMRGARGLDHLDALPVDSSDAAHGPHGSHSPHEEATQLLRDIRDALVSLGNQRGES